MLVISPFDGIFFCAIETDDTCPLVGIVDLLGTLIFIETYTNMKFQTDEIVLTTLLSLQWSVIQFISYINSQQLIKKSFFKNHVFAKFYVYYLFWSY